MSHYRVIVTGKDLSQVFVGASLWHAIDQAYTKWCSQAPDRSKYKASSLNG